MKYKLVIFDLDLTLLYAGKLYCEVRDILEYLKTNDVLIALASYNAEADYKLRYHGIEDFFQYIFYEDWQQKNSLDWKHQMLSEILSLSGIPSNETVFFDDYGNNLDTARRLGITAVEVDPDQGVNMKLIKETLQSENELHTYS
ncbi:HAD family hydrolase [bacterium]|nr:HAD family hydrolase [bacterium]